MGSSKTVEITAELGEGQTLRAQVGKHTMHIDQPQNAGGNDLGPTPLQYLELALAGCIGSIARIVAHQRKIELRSMSIKVTGELNTDGLLGRAPEAKVGFPEFRVSVSLDADLSPEQKMEFLEEVDRRCPVSDSLHAATKIQLEVVG